MRANIPTDNYFDSIQPVEDQKPTLSKEQIELAKIGTSPDWSLIKDYINQRCDIYRIGLFGEDLSGKDTSVIGQRFLAAQSVVREFTELVEEIERVTETVKEVSKSNNG